MPNATVGVAGAILLLAPLPLGLRTAELTILVFTGICLLLASRQLGTSKLHVPGLLLGLVSLGTAAAWMRGDDVNAFQFFRATVFPCLLFWLLHERISPGFLGNLEKLLPFAILGAGLSLLLYFGFEAALYNSTLDIPYADAFYKRLYVYPTYLFLILLFDAVRGNRSSQFIYVILLAVAGSRVIMACMVAIYMYFGFRNASRSRLLLLLAGCVVLVAIAILGGLFERISDQLGQGDSVRFRETLAAAGRLVDPVRFLIGNGGGVVYWFGHSGIPAVHGVDGRAVINTMYDVHNGFMTLALRFGAPVAILCVVAFVRSVPRVDGRWLLVAVLSANILLSHGPVQTVEAVGLALGVRLLAHRLSYAGQGGLRPS